MSYEHLLHAEDLERAPVFGPHVAKVIDQLATDLEGNEISEPPISVLVRTQNKVNQLESLYQDIMMQSYSGEVELVVVDTESRDGTVDFASGVGATLVHIFQEDFDYPYALNQGFRAASYDKVLMTVDHANLTNDQTLRAVAANIVDNTVGVYGLALPSSHASRTERYFAGVVWPQVKPIAQVEDMSLGIMAATGAALSREAWQEVGGFDERYAAGGEDGAMAKALLEKGYNLSRTPLLAVHHSHGLGPINSLRQIRHWMSLGKPQEFDAAKVVSRRPDLREVLEPFQD